MTGYRSALIRVINQYCLHFRSEIWRDRLLMAEEGMLSESFCQALLAEAKYAAEGINDQGNYLGRPPNNASELYAEGPPDIILGHLIERDLPVGIKLLDRPRNILGLGGAGSGKTVLCRNFCIQVDKLNQTKLGPPTLFTIMDFKSDFKGLTKILKTPTKLYSPNDHLKFGLNAPEGVPPAVWIVKISMILAGRLGLIASRIAFAGLIQLFLGQMNPGLTKNDLQDPTVSKDLVWPPLKLILKAALKKEIISLTSHKTDYGKTLTHNLMGLLQDSGNLFDCCNGIDINKELQAGNHCIFDVSSIPPYLMHIIHDIVASQRLTKKLYTNHKCDRTEDLFIVDECDLLIESDLASFPNGLSSQELIQRVGRELGIMSFTCISGPRYLSHHIKRNTFYTFAFNQADADSAYLMSQELQIDPRCIKMLSSLPPGQCIFRQTQTAWSNAMWCQMDYVAPDRDFQNIHYSHHPYVKSLREDESDALVQSISEQCKKAKERSKKKANKKPSAIELIALKLLKLRAENPYYPVVRLFERLGKIHFNTQKKIRQHLEDLKLACFEEPQIGRTRMLLMELTPAGYESLGINPPQENKGRGSITHRHLAHWIRLFFEHQNHKALIEYLLPGTSHPVDLAVLFDPHIEVFEICVTAFDNLSLHLEACFEKSTVPIKKLTIIVGTKTEMKDLKKKLMSDILTARFIHKVELDSIDNYMLKEFKK